MGVNPKPRPAYLAELLEERTLLSAYSVNTMGRLGLNDTGANPQSLVMDAAGNLFGTSLKGGTYGNGTVFEIASGSSTVTPLAAFPDPQGFASGPLVVDGAGNLFGTTFAGGAGNLGSLFEVVKGSGVATTLVSFSFSLGTGPEGGLITDAKGNLYGNTNAGGLNDFGTIFELPNGTTTPIVLASLDGATGRPQGGMAVDTAGNLFGITNGRVYELPVGALKPITLASFPSSRGPTGGVILDQTGNIFGATGIGGANGVGSLFEIVKGSGTITTLVSFNVSNGEYPTMPAMDSAGNLYGNASSNTSDGEVYKLPAGSGVISVLATFAYNQGVGGANVVVDGGGNVWGTTPSGGSAGAGRVYKVPSGAGPVTIASFAPTTGLNPNGGIVADAQGNLWGTTRAGGTFGFGTLFQVDPAGNISVVASFNGANGKLPNGNVVVDDDGNVFGTTNLGAAHGAGNVFEWERSSGNLLSLVDFNGSNGSQPTTGLVRDKFGNIFGTGYGYSSGSDSVFKLAAGTHVFSTVATLYTDSYGVGNLTVDSAGNVFGTTDTGVFEIASGTSTVTPLVTFPSGQSGAGRDVVVDANGNVFGTTQYGGAFFVGSVYEIVKGSNAFTTIVSFGALESGQLPTPELKEDDAGNVYGILGSTSTTSTAMYEVAAGTHSLSILTSFNHLTGIRSFVRDTDGTFRGVLSSATAFEAVPPALTARLRRDPDQIHIDWTIGSKSGKMVATDANGLNISGGAGNDVITLDYSYGNPLPHVIHLNGSFTVAGIEGDNPFAGSTLDIGESTVYLNYLPGTGLVSFISQDVHAGYDGGHWRGFGDGPDGAITTLNFMPDQIGLGFADSADGVVAGQPANTIEIKYTVMGDTNLDGVVNSLDAITMTRNYLSPGPLNWDKGDFNFDGSVDVNDATILQKNYNRSVATAPAVAGAVVTPVAVPAAPEPSPPAPILSPVTAQSPSTEKGHNGWDDHDDPGKKRGKGKSAVTQNHTVKEHR